MRSFVVAFFIVAIFSSPRVADACTCGPKKGVDDERDRSDAVFEVDLAPNHVGRVTRVWKGSPPPQMTIAPTDCPPTPDVGRWLVYGYEGGGVWHANMCGRSRAFPAAESDLETLGTPLGPPAAPPPPPHDPPIRASGDPMAGAPLEGGPPPEPPRPSSCACREGSASGSAAPLALALALVVTTRARRIRRLL